MNAGFELRSQLVFGQYLPTGSVLHRLDPRARLASFGLLALALMLGSTAAGLAVGLGVVLSLAFVARLSLRYLWGNLRTVLPFLALLAALQVFFYSSGKRCFALWSAGFVTISDCGLHLAVLSFLRFMALFLLLNLLASCMTNAELARGVGWLLRPGERFGLPAHELSMILSLALRFVPILAGEMERIMKAQAARGADFGAGRGWAIRRAQKMLPLFIPLFLLSLRRAERLALAMEARCYRSGTGRTYLIRLQSRPVDFVFFALAGLLSALILGANFVEADRLILECFKGFFK